MVLRGGAGLFYDRPFGNSVIFMPGNPPSAKNVTVRYSQLQSLGTRRPDDARRAGAEHDRSTTPKLPSSTQWNGGVQMTLPWSVALDVEYVGQHSFNTVRTVNINAVDFGAAFLPQEPGPERWRARRRWRPRCRPT